MFNSKAHGLVFIIAMFITFNVLSGQRFPLSSTPKQEQFNLLVSQLRCVVCQGQSLSESYARVAMDIKEVVFNLVEEGRSNEEIKLYLTERYGDYILHRTPVNEKTYLLWLLPFMLLVSGILILSLLYKKSHR